MTEREKIPEPLKRLVRQECNFGCAICGMPIFEYDHIIPYSQVLKHDLENLILLCPNHHSAKGKQLDVERVKEAKLNPFNKGKSIIEGYKFEKNKKIDIHIGTNILYDELKKADGYYPCVWINGQYFFVIHCVNDWVTMSFAITDTNGQVILSVNYGELQFSAHIWDFKYEGSNIQIRTGSGQILLDINLSNYKVEILRGCFIHSATGDGFVIEPPGWLLTKSQGNTVSWDVHGNYYGGLGFWNRSKYPDIVGPKGGFARMRIT